MTSSRSCAGGISRGSPAAAAGSLATCASRESRRPRGEGRPTAARRGGAQRALCARARLPHQAGPLHLYADIPSGPTIEISSLPSAGDGAGGGRSCPSGGCGSYVTPSYSFVYSGVGSYDYWPAGLYYGGALCPPHVRRFRGGEFAFGGRFGSFVQERRFAAGKFMGARLGFQSSAGRRFQAGGRFGANGTRRWR